MRELTASDFTADNNGMYSSPLTSYEVLDQAHGLKSADGIPLVSLVLIANDNEGNSIDCGAGPHATWAELLTELNHFSALDANEATTPDQLNPHKLQAMQPYNVMTTPTTAEFQANQRVEAHPATDCWMMGDRYGNVTKVSRTHVTVKMDKSGKSLRFTPANLLAV